MADEHSIRPGVLDQIRESLGLTSDRQLAQRLDCTTETIRRLRRGTAPSLRTALLVAKLADTEVSSVLTGISRK